MEIKQRDHVRIDGKVAMVECWWGQGRHRVFRLDDGRTVFDLHKLLERGDAEIVEHAIVVEGEVDPDPETVKAAREAEQAKREKLSKMTMEEQVAELTPSDEELVRLAEEHPAPDSFFRSLDEDEDEEDED